MHSWSVGGAARNSCTAVAEAAEPALVEVLLPQTACRHSFFLLNSGTLKIGFETTKEKTYHVKATGLEILLPQAAYRHNFSCLTLARG